MLVQTSGEGLHCAKRWKFHGQIFKHIERGSAEDHKVALEIL